MEEELLFTEMEAPFEDEQRLTGFIDYASRFKDLVGGKISTSRKTTGFDIDANGHITGDNIEGEFTGADFIKEGEKRFFLNPHASIITEDGVKINVVQTGISDAGDLKLYMSFYTKDKRYAWLNNRQFLGFGYVDSLAGIASVRGYLI